MSQKSGWVTLCKYLGIGAVDHNLILEVIVCR